MADISKGKITEYSPLALAFIGDAVHTLFVRDYIIKNQNLNARSLHLLSAKICKAKTQSQILDRIFSFLDEEEKGIALRARNHKSHAAKNANPEEYKKATAFEAVLGYLYLIGEQKRLEVLLQKSVELLGR